jgi:alpha-ketoglutarate-dependent taurine dioxygenase
MLTNTSKGGGIRRIHDDLSRWASVAWHSDVSFENVPADYSMLKINILPESGGDTMWASTSDVRLSLAHPQTSTNIIRFSTR